MSRSPGLGSIQIDPAFLAWIAAAWLLACAVTIGVVLWRCRGARRPPS